MFETTLIFLVVAFATGCLSDLLAFCMGDPADGDVKRGRIFSRLGQRLADHYDVRKLEIEKEAQRAALRRVEYKVPMNWWKLFVCPTCYNVWVTAFVIALLALWLVHWCGPYYLFCFLLLPVCLGVSHLARGMARQYRR